jgi:hypothetical protein
MTLGDPNIVLKTSAELLEGQAGKLSGVEGVGVVQMHLQVST